MAENHRLDASATGTITSVDIVQKRTYVEVDAVFMGKKALQLAVGDTIMTFGDASDVVGTRVIVGARMVDGPTPPFNAEIMFVSDSQRRIASCSASTYRIEDHVVSQALVLDFDACGRWLLDSGVPDSEVCIEQGGGCDVAPRGASSVAGVVSLALVVLWVLGLGRKRLRRS